MTCPHCGGEIATDGHGVVSCQKCRRVPAPMATHVMVPMPVDDVTWWAESMLIDPDGYPTPPLDPRYSPPWTREHPHHNT